jgi:hypothetical protein
VERIVGFLQPFVFESFAILFCVIGVALMSPHLFVVGGVLALLPSLVDRWAQYQKKRELKTFLGFCMFVIYIAFLFWFMFWL